MHRCAKFQVCRYARFGDISEGLPNFIGVTWPRPTPLYRILIGQFGKIVRMHPCAKFLVCSFIRFRDMFEGVPNFIRVTWPRPWQKILGWFRVWPEEVGQGHCKVGHQDGVLWGSIPTKFHQNLIINDKVMDFNFSVFGSKMGLWPWKVGQGHWKWVSVFRSTRGPYLYMCHVCQINFVC